MPIGFSVLDQSPIPESSTAGDALRNTLDLACLADKLGYHRYWLAEHHGTRGLACASREAIVGPVASATSRLRVGTGGVMLPHYSPLKVAETFSMLSGLFPSRIDLGIGGAAGTSAAVAFALQRDRRQPAPDDFREQLDELLGHFANRAPASGPFRQHLNAHFESPEIWLLGSSPERHLGCRDGSAVRICRFHQSPRRSDGGMVSRTLRRIGPGVRSACRSGRLGDLR